MLQMKYVENKITKIKIDKYKLLCIFIFIYNVFIGMIIKIRMAFKTIRTESS